MPDIVCHVKATWSLRRGARRVASRPFWSADVATATGVSAARRIAGPSEAHCGRSTSAMILHAVVAGSAARAWGGDFPEVSRA